MHADRSPVAGASLDAAGKHQRTRRRAIFPRLDLGREFPFAVETMTAILSKELRGCSITVNAVAPGPTATDLFLNGKSPELIDRLAKMNPMERLGTPEDIASVVAFLVGPDGGWINGQVLRANGGMV